MVSARIKGLIGLRALAILLTALSLPGVGLFSIQQAQAKKSPLVDTTELSPELAAQVQRAAKAAKSGNPNKARDIIQNMLASAPDVSTCLAAASAADMVGFTLQDAKRACLQKALSLSKSRDDYFRCALKARQVQVFDITSDAIKQLLASASSTEELLDLARRAQEIAMNDVSHLALEKAFAQTHELDAALALAKQCRILGADDLAKKICREVIDDSQTCKDLMELLPGIEDFKYPEANRYLLKRALDFARNVDDEKAIFDAAHRLGQRDIEEVAGFRGRKMLQMQTMVNEEKAKEDAAAAAQKEESQPKAPSNGF
ncbi:MAG TPA: hypothetical protein V6C97_36815 [Oculatellaceae cyanobacterium]